MKYWVYKESRILGPFDKEAVSGLPGLDAGTLVCTGDPAGGNAWVPAAEVDGFSGLAAAPIYDDVPSSSSLLDQLQIESAGLLGDDEFPASFSEELFQDAGFKKDFSDILNDHISPDEREARRSREKIIELTNKLESMFRQVAELESGKSELARKLAARDFEVRTSGAAPASHFAPEPAPAPIEGKTFLSPAPPPIPGGPPPIAAVPQVDPAPSEWPQTPVAETAFPSFAAPTGLPIAEDAATPPALPPIPSFEAAAPSAETSAVPEPQPLSFSKPKSFKIVPTMKSFKVLGAAEAAPDSANPVPEFKFEEAPAVAAAAPVVPAVPAPAPIEPISLAPVVPPPPAPAPMPAFAPAPVPAPEPAPIPTPFSFPPPEPVAAVPTPAPPPPNTLSRAMPVPDLGAADEATQAPPMTMARSGAAAGEAAVEDSAAARFAKPEPAPATGEIKKPARNNKPFLIGGGVLLILLIVLGVIFMRQPKDDLKQMATLDDGQAPIGVPADDTAAAPPPFVKPKLAEAPPEPPPAPVPAGPSAEHAAAIEAVKDFPLDGERGTVGRWLQYSYTASSDAGAEEWNASTTGDDTILVEYRLVPSAADGKSALYLFEIDGSGIVAGKNLEARQMLAGSPPPEAPKPKKKPVKKAPKRRAVVEEPKEVPLLPLPDSGELRPPSEDDGSFGSDTVNQGI